MFTRRRFPLSSDVDARDRAVLAWSRVDDAGNMTVCLAKGEDTISEAPGAPPERRPDCGARRVHDVSHPCAAIGRPLERWGGGFETDVYRTADHRFVVKLKPTISCLTIQQAVDRADAQRAIAHLFSAYLGDGPTIWSEYLVTQDERGEPRTVVIQPFVDHARPLYAVAYERLPHVERARVLRQLRVIIDRSRACYRATGLLPDLYGVGGSAAELARLRTPSITPTHIWNFFVRRTLLRSHNMLLTDAPERRVVLVDYDLALHNRPLARRVHSAFRMLLFWRDLLLLSWGDRAARRKRRAC